MKRGLVIGIAVGALAVVAVGGAAIWWLTRPESADDAAQRYVRALESGDRTALAEFLADDPERDRLLDQLDDATSRIADATVSSADAPEGEEGYSAAVTLDGSPGVVRFTLSDASGRWRLSGDYVAQLEVTTTLGSAVDIGGVTVPAGTTTLLPAVYAVRAAPAGVLTGEATVAATNDAPLTVAVEASVSSGATALAQAQLDAYAEACAKPATEVRAHCGLRVPWGADLTALTGLQFRIEKTPQVVLTADAASFDATGGVIVATARGTARSGGAGVFTYRADDWALRGSVSFDADAMVLRVR